MRPFGTATVMHREDGTLYVGQADETIGIAASLLAEADRGLPVDAEGCIMLAGDPAYRYRPVRFADILDGGCSVVVCERVGPAIVD